MAEQFTWNPDDSTPPPAFMGDIPTTAPYPSLSSGPQVEIPTTYTYAPGVGFVPSNWQGNAQSTGSDWRSNAQSGWMGNASGLPGQGSGWQGNAGSHGNWRTVLGALQHPSTWNPTLTGPNGIGGLYAQGSGGAGESAGMGGGFGAASAAGNYGWAPGGGGNISHFIQALLHGH